MFNGRKLREIRESHNMTQKKTAGLFNITPSALSNYERGTRVPSNAFLKLFSAMFNISDEEFMIILFDDSVNEGFSEYSSSKIALKNFIILDEKKMNDLPYSELKQIKDFADFIYERYKNKK